MINCGSSSIKYKLYGIEIGAALAAGIIEGIGTERVRHRHRVGEYETTVEAAATDYRSGVAQVVEALAGWGSPPPLADPGQIVGVGHRVVHGGDRFSESVVIDSSVVEAIKALDSLAPLHNPANRAGISATQELLPEATEVAVFDTAFFATLPPHAYRYAVPSYWWREHGVRRYGFHGISHRYLVERAAQLWKKPPAQSGHLSFGKRGIGVRGPLRPGSGHIDGDDPLGGTGDGHPERRHRPGRGVSSHGMRA